MNTDGHRLTKVMVGGISVLLLMTGQALAQPCGGYEVTAIVSMDECPPFGIPPVVPFGINEEGWMVGFFQSCVIGPDTAFLWTPDDGLVVIPMPGGTSRSHAVAISGSRVVGWYDNADLELGTAGFLYDLARDEFTSLGTLPGGNTSFAEGINSAGEIVGSWGDTVKGPFPQAFIWRDGEMIDIHPGFPTPRSRACDINASSQATGWMGQAPQTDARAFIWDDGKVTELPPIPGGFTSDGEAISNCGQLAGHGRKLDSDGSLLVRAFLWNKQEMIELGTLPGFIWSASLDITPDGSQVVGQSWNIDGNPNIRRGFVWADGVIRDLNDLIDPNADLSIESAIGINQAGQILARGHSDDLNATVGILLSPLQQGITGDLDHDGEVGVKDLLIFLGSWGPCPPQGDCPADFDDSGDVGVMDLLFLLGSWGPCPCNPGAVVLSVEEEMENAGLTMEDWVAFVNVMQTGSEAEKENWMCWMDHYLNHCQPPLCTEALCPDDDPFGGHRH